MVDRQKASEPFIITMNGEKRELPVAHLTQSLSQLLSHLHSKCDDVPLKGLIALYGQIFPQPLPTVLGKDQNSDLNAIFSLRNLFAHGGDIYMEFKGSFGGEATLDSNPIKPAIDQLNAAGIIKGFRDITQKNYQQFLEQLYSDAALLYFLGAVQTIEKKLKSSSKFPMEDHVLALPSLPNLTL